MDTPDRQPLRRSPFKTPTLALLVAAVLIVRRTGQDTARLSAEIAALQNEVESLRTEVNNLRAESERTAVLSLTDGGYFLVRTNGGTLLVAVAVANLELCGCAAGRSALCGGPYQGRIRGFR